ncbi:hypothetical protein AAG570_006435 [Ranatra chinensis]|uniref:WW domain-containing protein n=1 Tax=Ranatra chinensis TaxID=642074 RepID=A0ABD0YU23_9HEMI
MDSRLHTLPPDSPDWSVSSRSTGRQFESQIFTKLTNGQHGLGTQRLRTTAYYPQANGVFEREHRSLKATLTARLDSANWVRHLPSVLLGIRVVVKEDSKASNAELVYGRTLRLPGDMFSDTQPAETEAVLQKLLQELTACPFPPHGGAQTHEYNKPSIQYHESGKRHKENVAKKISTLAKQSAKQYKENTKLDEEMKKMEEEALKAYKMDMEINPDITSREIKKKLEGHVQEINELSDVTMEPKGNRIATPCNNEGESSQNHEDQKPTIWYRSQSGQDCTYYWNPLTMESKWEIPSGNCKILDEASKDNESKKAIKICQLEEENSRKMKEEEIKAFKNREKMRIKYSKTNEAKIDKESKNEGNGSNSLNSKAKPKNVVGNPYGKWTVVVKSDEKPIDLQLPSKGNAEIKAAAAAARAANLLAEAEKQEEEEVWKIEIGEKTVGNRCSSESIGMVDDTGPSIFKKRKLNNRANMRQRSNCTDEDYCS